MPCTLSTTDEKIWHIAPMSEGFSRLEERKYLWKWGDKRLGRGQVQETKMTQSRTHCTHLLGIAFHKNSNFKWDISIFYKIFLYWFYNVLYERCVCVCVLHRCVSHAQWWQEKQTLLPVSIAMVAKLHSHNRQEFLGYLLPGQNFASCNMKKAGTNLKFNFKLVQK